MLRKRRVVDKIGNGNAKTAAYDRLLCTGPHNAACVKKARQGGRQVPVIGTWRVRRLRCSEGTNASKQGI